MKEYYITQDAPADGVVRIEDIFGQVQLADTIVRKMYQELLETGAALKMKLVPYGFGIKNDKGEITEFKLSGFKVVFEEDEILRPLDLNGEIERWEAPHGNKEE